MITTHCDCFVGLVVKVSGLEVGVGSLNHDPVIAVT